MTTLSLRNLNKAFSDGDWAVRDVDVDISDGELFVIVGPSGSGKTTLLRLVAGLEHPTAGDVVIDGERTNDVPPARRGVALAFQNYALYPHMTVAENIGFPLRMEGMHATVRDRRIGDVAQALQLDDVLDRKPTQLSGGQQQRVALARAIIRRPRLLLMDEPLSNLDAKLRIQTRLVISHLQRRLALTTLHVTHDQDEAMSIGDRMAVMHRGRIVQYGRPIDIYDAPADLFVAQFIGAPAMGAVVASVVVHDDTPALRVGDQDIELDALAHRRFPTLGRFAGRTVVLGLRADALSFDPDGPLAFSVVATDDVDRRSYAVLHVDAPSVTWAGDRVVVGRRPSSLVPVAIADRTPISLWEPFRVSIDPSRIHLFDLESGHHLSPVRRNSAIGVARIPR